MNTTKKTMLQALAVSEGDGWERRRGYPDHFLFAKLPPLDEIEWAYHVVSPQILTHIRNEPTWSRFAYSPWDAAAFVRAHPETDFAKKIEHIRGEGLDWMACPIILQPTSGGRLVIFDGNRRIVAAMLDGRTEITCIRGTHPKMARWHYYQDRGRFTNWLQGRRDKRLHRRARRADY